MNSRLEISGKYFASGISSLVSSGSMSDSSDSFSPKENSGRFKKGLTSDETELQSCQVATNGNDEEKMAGSLEERKTGFRMIYVTAMASMLCAVSVGYMTVYAGPATYDMQHRPNSKMKVTDDEVSWIASILPFGILPNIPFSVYMADRFGRKETLIWNSVPFVISWLFVICAPSAMYVLIGRFIGGWATGVVFVVLPMYAVEISSADTRGIIGASFQSFVAIGSLLTMGLGAVLSWIWLAVAGLACVVAALICFSPMPESPRWLVAKGRKKEALKAIRFLHADKVDAEKECQMIEEQLKTQVEAKFSIQNLKQPIIYKPALISLGIMFFVPFSGSAIVILFSSDIMHNAQTSLDPKYATIIVGATQAITTVLSSSIMDKAGRRVLLLVSGFLMGVSHAVLGTSFYMIEHDSTFPSRFGWLPLTSLLFYVAVFSIGYGPIPWLMLSEMVPNRERSFLCGVASCFYSAMGFIVTKTFEDLKSAVKFQGIFWIYSAFCFLSCVFVYFLVPETKGKSLEEIQSIFASSEQVAFCDDEQTAESDGTAKEAFKEIVTDFY